jgi:DNA-binding transcriptional regulator YiaG
MKDARVVELGCLLARAREKLGLSQAELSRRTNVPVQTIANWEQGRRHPLLLSIVSLLKTLEIDLGQLSTLKSIRPAP